MRGFLRWGLVFLTAMQTLLGAWTLLLPRTFYDTVPTVNLTPPYSEHLFRDFGAATLGLAFVLGSAAVFLEYRLVCTSLVAYGIFAVGHLVFHVTHLQHFETGQAVLLTVGLTAIAILAMVLPVLARRLRPALP